MPDQMMGTYKPAVLSTGHSNTFYQASRVSLQAINIGDVCVNITLVSAKQVYNGKVNLINETEP